MPRTLVLNIVPLTKGVFRKFACVKSPSQIACNPQEPLINLIFIIIVQAILLIFSITVHVENRIGMLSAGSSQFAHIIIFFILINHDTFSKFFFIRHLNYLSLFDTLSITDKINFVNSLFEKFFGREA